MKHPDSDPAAHWFNPARVFVSFFWCMDLYALGVLAFRFAAGERIGWAMPLIFGVHFAVVSFLLLQKDGPCA